MKLDDCSGQCTVSIRQFRAEARPISHISIHYEMRLNEFITMLTFYECAHQALQRRAALFLPSSQASRSKLCGILCMHATSSTSDFSPPGPSFLHRRRRGTRGRLCLRLLMRPPRNGPIPYRFVTAMISRPPSRRVVPGATQGEGVSARAARLRRRRRLCCWLY